MMVEVVTTLGEPEPMSHQELFSLMVAVCWLLSNVLTKICASVGSGSEKTICTSSIGRPS